MDVRIERTKNPRKQGDAGMGVAIAWFSHKGYRVCIPLTDSQDYDLVIDNGDGLKRVQVKTTTRQTRKNFVVNLSVKGGVRSAGYSSKKLNSNNYELLFVVTGNGDLYLFPSEKVTATTELTLGKDKEIYKLQ